MTAQERKELELQKVETQKRLLQLFEELARGPAFVEELQAEIDSTVEELANINTMLRVE